MKRLVMFSMLVAACGPAPQEIDRPDAGVPPEVIACDAYTEVRVDMYSQLTQCPGQPPAGTRWALPLRDECDIRSACVDVLNKATACIAKLDPCPATDKEAKDLAYDVLDCIAPATGDDGMQCRTRGGANEEIPQP